MKAAQKAMLKGLILFVGMAFIIWPVAGCSFSIGGPQRKPEISPLEVQRNVKLEMENPKTRKLIEDAAKTQKLELLLDTPEADRVIQKEVVDSFDTPEVNRQLVQVVKKILEMPEVQKEFQEQVKNSLKAPEVQKAVKAAVQETIMKMIQQSGGGQGSDGVSFQVDEQSPLEGSSQ